MRLSVVTLSHNTKSLLLPCLQSLFSNLAQLDCDTEVFVVDSGSTDGSIETVSGEFPWVDLTVTDGFGGFAHANNLALRRATGEYQLLLNSDTVLPPGTLERMLQFMEAHPEAGLAGPRLVLADGSLDFACRRSFPTPSNSFYRLSGLGRVFPRSRRFGGYRLTYLDPDRTAEVDSVCGAFSLVRREAIQQAGLLDEDFFFYGEDLDWAFRFKEHGWKVYYYPEVQVLHYKGQTSRQQSERMIREFYRAMRLFYTKHYAEQYPKLTGLVVFAGIWLSERLTLLKNSLRPAEARRVST